MSREAMQRIGGQPRIGQMSPAALRKMCAMPMTRFEPQQAPPIARAVLKPNETWDPIVYVNTRYSVQLSWVETAVGRVLHLWIRRHDGQMPRAWSDMQSIKNQIAGPERAGVEVFPPESQLVDEANMAHLWVYPEDFVMPFRLGR